MRDGRTVRRREDHDATDESRGNQARARAALRPVDFLLHALAACLTAGIANVAAARGDVLNLSFRKRRTLEEIFRVMKPGGRISIADIVSAEPLSPSIVDDPKLWAG